MSYMHILSVLGYKITLYVPFIGVTYECVLLSVPLI